MKIPGKVGMACAHFLIETSIHLGDTQDDSQNSFRIWRMLFLLWWGALNLDFCHESSSTDALIYYIKYFLPYASYLLYLGKKICRSGIFRFCSSSKHKHKQKKKMMMVRMKKICLHLKNILCGKCVLSLCLSICSCHEKKKMQNNWDIYFVSFFAFNLVTVGIGRRIAIAWDISIWNTMMQMSSLHKRSFSSPAKPPAAIASPYVFEASPQIWLIIMTPTKVPKNIAMCFISFLKFFGEWLVSKIMRSLKVGGD